MLLQSSTKDARVWVRFPSPVFSLSLLLCGPCDGICIGEWKAADVKAAGSKKKIPTFAKDPWRRAFRESSFLFSAIFIIEIRNNNSQSKCRKILPPEGNKTKNESSLRCSSLVQIRLNAKLISCTSQTCRFYPQGSFVNQPSLEIAGVSINSKSEKDCRFCINSWRTSPEELQFRIILAIVLAWNHFYIQGRLPFQHVRNP